MKRVLIGILVLVSSVFFTACGGGDSSVVSQSVQNVGTNERMIVGKEYQIHKGDEIEKLSVNPKIEIVTDLNSSTTTAKLLSGQAAIIRY